MWMVKRKKNIVGLWCVLKEEHNNNQEVSFFLPSNSFDVSFYFFSFVVQKISGEGSLSFFAFNEALRDFHTQVLCSTLLHLGWRKLENQENSGLGASSFLFMWSGDLGLSTSSCDSWDQETLGLGNPKFSSSLKEGAGALQPCLLLQEVNKP